MNKRLAKPWLAAVGLQGRDGGGKLVQQDGDTEPGTAQRRRRWILPPCRLAGGRS